MKDRRLVTNEAEAETVCLIFERHRALGSLQRLAADLAARGVASKLRRMRDGRITGGKAYTAGALGYLLRNRLYIGQIRHGDQVYAGEHDSILDQASWEASQALLERSTPRPHTGQISLLSGLICDGHGRRMTAAHAIKADRRYRYYVSRPAKDIAAQPWRLPAGDIEGIVTREFVCLLNDPMRISAALGDACVQVSDIAARSAEFAINISLPTTFKQVLRNLSASISIDQDNIRIDLNAAALAAMITGCTTATPAGQRISFSCPVSLSRRGHELRMIHAAAEARPAERDDGLIRLLASGRAAYDELKQSSASRDSTQRSHLTRLARLRFLAPDIIAAILEGRQPVELTARSLRRIAVLPLDWPGQRRALGFA